MLSLAPLLALAGCSLFGEENSFTIEDENGVVTSAQLVLCGASTPFERQNGRFTAIRQIDCEGSGYIQLTDRDGDQRQCVVGYVTPAAEQNFTYQESECQPRFE